MIGVGKVKGIRKSCFTTEIRESAKRLSGNRNYSLVKGGLMLTATILVRWWWTSWAIGLEDKT